MGRRKRGWKAASSLSLDALRRLVETKASELAARRDELVAELEAIDADLTTGGGAPRKRGPGRPRKSRRGPGRPRKARRAGRPAGKRGGKRRGRKPGPKGQSELHNMIRSVLGSSSQPLRVVEIAKKVISAGYKTTSKVFHLIIGQRLAEMKDVKKAGRGLYTMK